MKRILLPALVLCGTLLAVAALFAAAAGANGTDGANPPRQRLFVLTDIANEPDDEESLVRLLAKAIAKEDARPLWIAVWGGRYEWRTPKGETHPVWATPTVCDRIGRHVIGGNSITRWREEYQLDFEARMNWSVTPEYGKANHNPVAILNGSRTRGIVRLSAKRGDTVALGTEGSFDPDGDALSYEWFAYEEASSIGGAKLVAKGETAELDLGGVAADAKGEIHVILKVRDNGEPNLFAYRRAIVTVK